MNLIEIGQHVGAERLRRDKGADLLGTTFSAAVNTHNTTQTPILSPNTFYWSSDLNLPKHTKNGEKPDSTLTLWFNTWLRFLNVYGVQESSPFFEKVRMIKTYIVINDCTTQTDCAAPIIAQYGFDPESKSEIIDITIDYIYIQLSRTFPEGSLFRVQCTMDTNDPDDNSEDFSAQSREVTFFSRYTDLLSEQIP